MRAKRLVISAVLIVAIGLGVWRATSPRSAAAEKPTQPSAADAAKNRVVSVTTAPVAEHDVPIYLEGLGNVVAFNTVTVKAQVDGRLDAVLFKEGQMVRKGDVLAQIDPRPYQVQLHQAEGALERDMVQLKNAQVNLERYSTLVEQKLVSEQQVGDQRASAGQLEGAVRMDRAAIEAAKLNLEFTKIVSPINGVTGVRLVDAGNIVRSSDQTGIVVITQIDPISVMFSLPQDDLPAVAREMREGQLTVEAYSRDGLTKLGTGKLILIDNQINQATATMRLKASFPNPEHLLWPNQFVKVRLLLKTRKNAIAVPSTVVQRGPKGSFAYVVDQTAQTVSVRPLELEAMVGDLALVTTGLKVGDEVVVDGQNSLKPGSKVSSRPVTPPGGGRGKSAQRDTKDGQHQKEAVQ